MRESARVFGQSTPALLASYDPATSLWRTSQLSLIEDLGESLETWPRSGMTRSGIAYQLQPLAPLTAETASGLLPTPAASPAGWRNIEIVDKNGNPPTHANQRWYDKKTGRVVQKDLRHVVERGMWPTPTASEHKYRLQGNTQQSKGLGAMARRGQLLTERERESGMSGQLNPTWVEWLMGFPLGWTDLGPSATRSSRKSQSGSAAASKSGKRAAK